MKIKPQKNFLLYGIVIPTHPEWCLGEDTGVGGKFPGSSES